MEGNIFNIQRFAIHDGPGIRTTVFFKGCNLRCFWCHNPESWQARPEIQIFPEKCIGCSRCLQVCPNHAHLLEEGHKIFLRDSCHACGICTDECYAESLVMMGQRLSVQEVMAHVELDGAFYANSGGGVTFSGGEPLLQKDFLKALLQESSQRGFHTAVDTAAHVPWESFEEILPYTDLFLFDLKAIDAERHKHATGVRNNTILDNLARLSRTGSEIIIRIPVIRGVNASKEDMQKMAQLLRTLSNVTWTELHNYHRLGEAKYISLGQTYAAPELTPCTTEELQKFGELFQQLGLVVKIS